jgi:hypothetical protein
MGELRRLWAEGLAKYLDKGGKDEKSYVDKLAEAIKGQGITDPKLMAPALKRLRVGDVKVDESNPNRPATEVILVFRDMTKRGVPIDLLQRLGAQNDPPKRDAITYIWLKAREQVPGEQQFSADLMNKMVESLVKQFGKRKVKIKKKGQPPKTEERPAKNAAEITANRVESVNPTTGEIKLQPISGSLYGTDDNINIDLSQIRFSRIVEGGRVGISGHMVFSDFYDVAVKSGLTPAEAEKATRKYLGAVLNSEVDGRKRTAKLACLKPLSYANGTFEVGKQKVCDEGGGGGGDPLEVTKDSKFTLELDTAAYALWGDGIKGKKPSASISTYGVLKYVKEPEKGLGYNFAFAGNTFYRQSMFGPMNDAGADVTDDGSADIKRIDQISGGLSYGNMDKAGGWRLYLDAGLLPVKQTDGAVLAIDPDLLGWGYAFSGALKSRSLAAKGTFKLRGAKVGGDGPNKKERKWGFDLSVDGGSANAQIAMDENHKGDPNITGGTGVARGSLPLTEKQPDRPDALSQNAFTLSLSGEWRPKYWFMLDLGARYAYIKNYAKGRPGSQHQAVAGIRAAFPFAADKDKKHVFYPSANVTGGVSVGQQRVVLATPTPEEAGGEECTPGFNCQGDGITNTQPANGNNELSKSPQEMMDRGYKMFDTGLMLKYVYNDIVTVGIAAGLVHFTDPSVKDWLMAKYVGFKAGVVW